MKNNNNSLPDAINESIHHHTAIFDKMTDLIYITDAQTNNIYYTNKKTNKSYNDLNSQKIPVFWNSHKAILHIIKLDHEKNRDSTATITLRCVQTLYETEDISKAIKKVLHIIGEFIGADRTYIFEKKGDKYQQTYEWCAKDVTPYINIHNWIEAKYFNIWIPHFNIHESYILTNVADLKEDFPEAYTMLKYKGCSAIVGIPLTMQGEIMGCILADNPCNNKIDNLTVLDTVSYFISLTFEKTAIQKALIKNSYIDGLTGLYNRNRYMQDLSYYKTNKMQIYAVVYIDINNLKSANDNIGHIFGDTMLKEAAGYLKRIFKDELIYRVGGDEFIILVKNQNKIYLEEQIQKLRNMFALSNTCSAAIGYIYENNGDIYDMVKEADKKMYENKKEYYRTHTNSSRYRSINDKTLSFQDSLEVKRALKNNEFIVYLQPKVAVDTKSIIGGEALIRYRNTNGKIIPPNEFIPILEDCHTIHLIDFFVFKTICKTISIWINEGAKVEPISINFSRFTIMKENFLETLLTIWSKYKVPKNLLEIEIIERDEDPKSEYIMKVMKKIKELGFRISIDDFGAQYSNLFLFSNTDIDTLKLDRSLILDLELNQKSQMVIDALSSLCGNLHVQLIVEGVETNTQLEILKKLHCDGVQGFLFSRPIPINEFKEQFVTFYQTD